MFPINVDSLYHIYPELLLNVAFNSNRMQKYTNNIILIGISAHIKTTIFDVSAPSYAESVFGAVNIKDDDDSEHTKGNMNFTPVYTFYNWGETAQPSAPPP